MTQKEIRKLYRFLKSHDLFTQYRTDVRLAINALNDFKFTCNLNMFNELNPVNAVAVWFENNHYGINAFQEKEWLTLKGF